MTVPPVVVAAGIVQDRQRRVLLARRPVGKHLAGHWEFPGGKLEPGEDASAALARELAEELGITVRASVPLLTLTHSYPEKTVRLIFHTVTDWGGVPEGREGQTLRWVRLDRLAQMELPAANRPVSRLLGLAPTLSITPHPEQFATRDEFLADWERRAAAGHLLQLRAHRLAHDRLRQLAGQCGVLARTHGARWLLNGPAELALEAGADGVHLTAACLAAATARPPGDDWLVSAACHAASDVRRAAALQLDFVTLSPIARTASHPEQAGKGFSWLKHICQDSPLPVYALGGMAPDDLRRVRHCGAFGVAGIRGFA